MLFPCIPHFSLWMMSYGECSTRPLLLQIQAMKTLHLQSNMDCHNAIPGIVTKLWMSCPKLLTFAIRRAELFGGWPHIRQGFVIFMLFGAVCWDHISGWLLCTSNRYTGLPMRSKMLCRMVFKQRSLTKPACQGSTTQQLDANPYKPHRFQTSHLDGLGRPIDPLTNHFKVEIGTKLIDCHCQLVDENMLREAAGGPLTDNEEIQKFSINCIIPVWIFSWRALPIMSSLPRP